jgi:hypothetical protein
MGLSQQRGSRICSQDTLQMLDQYNLTQQRSGWVGATPMKVIFAIVIAAIVAGAVVQLKLVPDDWLAGLNGAAVGALVITLGGAVVTYQQWRAARYEAALDKFYDKLEIANRRREALRGEGEVDPFDMYIFTELDNLEYTLEKYKLGYVMPAQLCRSLEMFRMRCEGIKGFADGASDLVSRAAYHPTTASIVRDICAQRNRKF